MHQQFKSSSSMNALHTLTALIELGAGFALLSFPSATVALLVGAPLEAARRLDRGTRRRGRAAGAGCRLLAGAR